jgi:hypothetical protein
MMPDQRQRAGGFTIPMLVEACVGAASWTLGLVFGPETKGKVTVADLASPDRGTRRFTELPVVSRRREPGDPMGVC